MARRRPRWATVFLPEFRELLIRIPKPLQIEIDKTISRLELYPYPEDSEDYPYHLQNVRLIKTSNFYILYAVEDSHIVLLRLFPRT